jgi:hypothetical protein
VSPLRTLRRYRQVRAAWSGKTIVILRDGSGLLYDVTGTATTGNGVTTIDIEPITRECEG